MRIGLLIAIRRELETFLKSGEAKEEETVAGKTIYKTRMEGHEIYAVQSGCGETDAAAATMLLIVKYNCDIILNFGVTGALDPSLKVEELFVVEKALPYGLDTSAIDPVKPGQYTEYPDEFIPLDSGLADLVTREMPEIRKVAAASGDRFVDDRGEKLRLREMGCGICDMEIAAIARVCERSGVKCLSIKCISDTFEGGAGDFNQNVRNSAGKAFAALRKIMKVL